VSAGSAFARVGLLGNPSDGYGGRVIAMTLPQFSATVTLEPADQWQFAASQLLRATVTQLQATHPQLVGAPAALSFSTTVPRQVGLAGSSAIVIAALRALGAGNGFEWDPIDLARTALHVETEQLGWTAGPQDRVVQAYQGLVDMDFAEPWQADRYTPLDPAALPPLFVAWNQTMGESSDVAHSQVRERWVAGDQQVHDAMEAFAQLATEGRRALDNNTATQDWPDLVDQAYELRSSIWNITAIDTALVETGRSHGAGVAFAGSGGAVIGCPRNPAHMDALAFAYQKLGAGFLDLTP